jgi:hypothetical protein
VNRPVGTVRKNNAQAADPRSHVGSGLSLYWTLTFESQLRRKLTVSIRLIAAAAVCDLVAPKQPQIHDLD